MSKLIIQGSKIPLPGQKKKSKKNFLKVWGIVSVSNLNMITADHDHLEHICQTWNLTPGDVVIFINKSWTLTRWVFRDPNGIPHLSLPARRNRCAEDRIYVSLDLLRDGTENLMADSELRMNWRAACRAVALMRQRRALWNEELASIFDE
jgi:hypothetical protein